jgi:hypothetical protein
MQFWPLGHSFAASHTWIEPAGHAAAATQCVPVKWCKKTYEQPGSCPVPVVVAQHTLPVAQLVDSWHSQSVPPSGIAEQSVLQADVPPPTGGSQQC